MTNIYPTVIKADANNDGVVDTFNQVAENRYVLTLTPSNSLPRTTGANPSEMAAGYEFSVKGHVTGDFNAPDLAYDDFTPGEGLKEAHFAKVGDALYDLQRVWDVK